jgi:hypothetical protein
MDLIFLPDPYETLVITDLEEELSLNLDKSDFNEIINFIKKEKPEWLEDE